MTTTPTARTFIIDPNVLGFEGYDSYPSLLVCDGWVMTAWWASGHSDTDCESYVSLLPSPYHGEHLAEYCPLITDEDLRQQDAVSRHYREVVGVPPPWMCGVCPWPEEDMVRRAQALWYAGPAALLGSEDPGCQVRYWAGMEVLITIDPRTLRFARALGISPRTVADHYGEQRVQMPLNALRSGAATSDEDCWYPDDLALAIAAREVWLGGRRVAGICVRDLVGSAVPVLLEVFQAMFPSVAGPTFKTLLAAECPEYVAEDLAPAWGPLGHGEVLVGRSSRGYRVVELVSATSGRSFRLHVDRGEAVACSMRLFSEHAAVELLARADVAGLSTDSYSVSFCE